MRLTVRLIVLLAAALFVASCSGARAGTPDQWGLDLGAEWVRVDDLPISARKNALFVELRDGALVLGGNDNAGCPPNAGCVGLPPPDLRSGVRYSAVDASWTVINDAPRGIAAWTSYAVVGERAFFWDGAAFFAYNLVADSWEMYDKPPVRPEAAFNLQAFGDRLLATQQRNAEYRGGDWLLDPESRQWEAVPSPPSELAGGRGMLADGDRLYLFEKLDDSGQPTQFRTWVLAGLDGQWEPLAETDQMRFPLGTFEAVLINPRLETASSRVNASGGPYAHGGIYDPRKDEWRELPNRPDPTGPHRSAAGVISADDQFIVRGYVGDWILRWDDSTWHKIPKLSPIRTGRADGWVGNSASGWAGDGILVVGGVVWNRFDGEVRSDAWIWRPRLDTAADDQD